MKRPLRVLGLAATLVGLAAWQSSAQSLNVGDAAPPIKVSKWVKGDKVEALDKDKTYVVEFWATWCGPCRVSIPHLTEMQKKYKGKIQFVGVSVWEQDQDKVEPFVKSMGDKMDYSVAIDDVPEGGDGNSGAMAKAWMAASASNGIPTAFIVAKGKVVWIGHPMEMDKPLEKVTEPDFNLAKFMEDMKKERAEQQAAQKKMMEEQQAMQKKLQPLIEKIQALGPNPAPSALLGVFDKALAESPELEAFLGPQKLILMVQTGAKGASAYADKLMEGPLKDSGEFWNQVAWSIVDPESKTDDSKRDYKLALKAANRANDATKGENGAILDTLALATFKNGNAAKAVELQEKAIKLMGDAAQDEMKERLKEFKKAASDKNP